MDTDTTTTETLTADELVTGSVVLFPCWVGPTVELLPRTAAAFIEYPETRVVYWAEGGYGIADRTARLTAA